MNLARFDSARQMLESVYSSSFGIINKHSDNRDEAVETLQMCIKEAGDRIHAGEKTVYLGFTRAGAPYCADQSLWLNLADITEYVFQMYADPGSGIYKAVLML